MTILQRDCKYRNLIILSVIYLFSHGVLLIATGRWWDDWCFYFENPFSVIYHMALELGRPSAFLSFGFAKLLPEPGYRIITFFLFYACMLFLQQILRNWLQLDDSACFWICAMYAIMPINDARIMLAVFPYTVGLFFFMAGMSHLSYSLFQDRLSLGRRVCALLLFLLSFTLNSNLFFFAIVFLMILKKERSLLRLLRYFDFILLPIVFFVLKAQFFPAHGIYAGYNSLSVNKLIKAVAYLLPADCYVMLSIVNNVTRLIRRYALVAVILVAMSIAVLYLWSRRSIAEKKDSSSSRADKKNIFLLAFLGILILSAGLFPYVTVQQSPFIYTTTNKGRDSMLSGFGVALIFYSVIRLILGPKLSRYVYTAFIVCSALFFNLMYLSFQQDYYRQLGFQYQLTQHQEVADAANIVYLNDDAGFINQRAMYQLNGNAEVVFGNTHRLIMNGFGGTSYLLSDLEANVSRPEYHMSDYDISHKRIDAVVTYAFSADLKDTIHLKFYELSNDPRFQEELRTYTSMSVALDGSAEYDAILQEAGYENLK